MDRTALLSKRGKVVVRFLLTTLLLHLFGQDLNRISGQDSIQAAGGTYNFSESAACCGTAFLYQWRGQADPPSTSALVIRGPAGWNGGDPLAFRFGQLSGGARWVYKVFEVSAVAGQYTAFYFLTVVDDKETARTDFLVTLTPVLGRASARVSTATRERVTVEWTPVAGALSYQVVLGQMVQGEFVPLRTIAPQLTAGNTVAYGTTFSSGLYRAVVRAFTADLPHRVLDIPRQFHSSESRVEFRIE